MIIVALLVIISTREVVLRKGHHLLKFPTKTEKKEINYNGGRKILRNKGPKNASSNFREGMKLGKISRKGLLRDVIYLNYYMVGLRETFIAVYSVHGVVITNLSSLQSL